MLQVKDLQVYYGVINAIKGVSFEVNEGEVIALIGANGAGKTTILHTITGLVTPKSGSVEFEGKNLVKTPAHKIVGLGMAHVPEGRRVFAHLTVYDNLMLGAFSLTSRAKIEENLKYVYSHFPRLEERKNQVAGTLTGGEQQIASRIAYDEIDVLLYFRDTVPKPQFDEAEYQLLRLCDVHNVPVATNIATAEVLIHGLERGDLDWRDIVHPQN